MGSITGQQILDRAWSKGQDDGTRWKATDALKWINDGQREIVRLLPKSNPITTTKALQAGVRQTFAGLSITNGVSIIDVTRNTTTGRAITQRARAFLDDTRPTWVSETGTTYHWMQDERDPTAFYIYQAAAGDSVEIVYAALPTDLANLNAAISLSDIYANALQLFLLHSFYSMGQTYTKNPALAATFWTMFAQSLGLGDTATRQSAQEGRQHAAGA